MPGLKRDDRFVQLAHSQINTLTLLSQEGGSGTHKTYFYAVIRKTFQHHLIEDRILYYQPNMLSEATLLHITVDYVTNAWLFISLSLLEMNSHAASTSCNSSPDYGVLTFHYVDDDRGLHYFILSFAPFPRDTPKTGFNVVEFDTKVPCNNRDDVEDVSNVWIVKDGASNVHGFFKPLPCACHILNTIGEEITESYDDSGLSSKTE